MDLAKEEEAAAADVLSLRDRVAEACEAERPHLSREDWTRGGFAPQLRPVSLPEPECADDGGPAIPPKIEFDENEKWRKLVADLEAVEARGVVRLDAGRPDFVTQFRHRCEAPGRPGVFREPQPPKDWNFETFRRRFGDQLWRLSDTHGVCMTFEDYWRYVRVQEGGFAAMDGGAEAEGSEYPRGQEDASHYEDPDGASDGGDYSRDQSDGHSDGSSGASDSEDLAEEFEWQRSQWELYADALTIPGHDAPLALYDSQFADFSGGKELVGAYTTPPCFSPDLLRILEDEGRRPPYRWILVGASRSGTGMHIDPLRTDAWLTLTQGRKRWALFPPGTPWHALGLDAEAPQLEAIHWFARFAVARDGMPDAVELTQLPGECVYVPAGWAHCVLNLEASVAVTHNYAPEPPQEVTSGPRALRAQLQGLWDTIRVDEPDLARPFASRLAACRPDLASELIGVPAMDLASDQALRREQR